MIGDTPESDICGGNKKGWTTILVKTGCFDGSKQKNDKKNPAKYVVEDFTAAMKLIYKLEKIPFEWSFTQIGFWITLIMLTQWTD